MAEEIDKLLSESINNHINENKINILGNPLPKNDENLQIDWKNPGDFEFEYFDSLGSIKNYRYELSPQYEGYMVFFPASLRHCVYPFYETDEPRVSIAGNISYAPL